MTTLKNGQLQMSPGLYNSCNSATWNHFQT